MLRTLRLSVLLAAALALAACAGNGGATPEAAYDAAREAQQRGAYDDLYDLLAPTTQKEFLGTVLVHCSFATLGPDAEQNARIEAALDAVFAKHGVTGIEENALQAVARAAEVLEDPGALAADMAAFAMEHRGTVGILELVDVREVEVEGDAARGTAGLRTKEGQTRVRDVEFVRVDGRWRLRLLLQ